MGIVGIIGIIMVLIGFATIFICACMPDEKWSERLENFATSGLMMIIIGFICIVFAGALKEEPKKIVTVTTELGSYEYNNCNYLLHTDFIEIRQDNQKIIYYNPIEVKIK